MMRCLSLQCQELWLGKAHIPRIAMAQGLPKMVASLLSIRDGNRVSLSSPSLYLSWRAAQHPGRVHLLTVLYQRKH